MGAESCAVSRFLEVDSPRARSTSCHPVTQVLANGKSVPGHAQFQNIRVMLIAITIQIDSFGHGGHREPTMSTSFSKSLFKVYEPRSPVAPCLGAGLELVRQLACSRLT